MDTLLNVQRYCNHGTGIRPNSNSSRKCSNGFIDNQQCWLVVSMQKLNINDLEEEEEEEDDDEDLQEIPKFEFISLHCQFSHPNPSSL